jgi:hypothetical protein
MGREQSVFAIIYKYILESAAITFFFLKTHKAPYRESIHFTYSIYLFVS